MQVKEDDIKIELDNSKSPLKANDHAQNNGDGAVPQDQDNTDGDND